MKFRPHSTLIAVLAMTCLWIQDTAAMNDEINNSQDMQTAIELLFQAYSESDTEARGDLLNRAKMTRGINMKIFCTESRYRDRITVDLICDAWMCWSDLRGSYYYLWILSALSTTNV